MTEYVLISDIHGNAPALQAVLDKEGQDKQYIVLGDIHGLLGFPDETQRLVQDVAGHVIAGNHDKAIFHYNEGHVNDDALSAFELNHTVSNLSEEQQQWMRRLPFFQIVKLDGQRVCLAHAMPWPDQASGYELGNAGIQKSDVTRIASIVSQDYDWVFHGHTHEQYSLDCSRFGHDVQFVNPGTLGYEQEYAVVDTATGDVSLKQVESTDEDVKSHLKEVMPDDAPSVEQWYY